MSSEEPPKILITAALPYANGPIHIGHLAGAYLPADLYARYKRLTGADVLFVCGSDEMGVAIVIQASNEGISPRDLVDKYHPLIESSLKNFGVSFDYYGRTSSPSHTQASQEFFRTLSAAGHFRTSTEKQLFDPEVGMFLADRYVIGTCPNCNFDQAYGDQCENCGTALSPSELLEPRSTLSSAVPEYRETTHWYLKLGDFQDALSSWIASKKGWKPNVLGQVRSWLNEGLRDRAITRDVSWGVPVPPDVAEEDGVDAKDKVIYVWFDAPIGYISASMDWARQIGDPDKWKSYWQGDGDLYHFIGKDNIVFHCLMFPAMLMAHKGYVLPTNVPANEFLNIEGKKLSTSRGWAVWLHEFLQDFDADYLRYTLAATLPETKDTDFNWSDFQARVNNELADVLGNFVNRTLSFTNRFFDGTVPPLVGPSVYDEEVLEAIGGFPEKIARSYEAFRFREAVQETMNLARLGNKYFNDTEPWHTRKTDMDKCGNTLHVSIQICAALSVLFDPVVPGFTMKLRQLLAMKSSVDSTSSTDGTSVKWSDVRPPLVAPGAKIGPAEILFNKIDDDVIEQQVDKLGSGAPEVEYVKPGENIAFDSFSAIDLRAAKVLACERVPKTDRLLVLDVDLGYEKRKIVSGIAEHIKPEELVGRTVVVVANLEARKIRGIESKGMLLTAEGPDGALEIVATKAVPGSVIK